MSWRCCVVVFLFLFFQTRPIPAYSFIYIREGKLMFPRSVIITCCFTLGSINFKYLHELCALHWLRIRNISPELEVDVTTLRITTLWSVFVEICVNAESLMDKSVIFGTQWYAREAIRAVRMVCVSVTILHITYSSECPILPIVCHTLTVMLRYSFGSHFSKTVKMSSLTFKQNADTGRDSSVPSEAVYN